MRSSRDSCCRITDSFSTCPNHTTTVSSPALRIAWDFDSSDAKYWRCKYCGTCGKDDTQCIWSLLVHQGSLSASIPAPQHLESFPGTSPLPAWELLVWAQHWEPPSNLNAKPSAKQCKGTQTVLYGNNSGLISSALLKYPQKSMFK